MILNLFSIFDPATNNLFSLNWIRSFYILIFFPNLFWLIPSRWNYLYICIFKYLINEFYILIRYKINNINIIIFIRIFIIIILNNFLRIFSYIYTSSSQISFRLSLSLRIWISIILFGWFNNINHIFIHLVPQGTPSILIPFIVLIESIRNIIRPLTLAVRLSANIIAGHLLITLISSTCLNNNIILIFIILFIQNILIILELSVSIIQAYVFTILRSLYRTETNYDKINFISTLSFSNIKTMTFIDFI